MSSRVPPSSDASRPKSKSRVLTPTSDSSVNKPRHGRLPPSSTSSRKRKNDEKLPEASKTRKRDGGFLPMEELLKPSIVIKPHPPNLMLKPHTLLPLMLLPREHLPLSCLDLSTPHGDFHAGRFYESRIRIMELEGRLGSNILIAQSNSYDSVYAIERDENGLYVLCKLGAWARLEKLSQQATAVCPQRIRPSTTHASTGTFEPPLITPQLHKENKRKRAAIEEIQSMVRKRPRARSVAIRATSEQQSAASHLPTPVEDTSQPPPTEQPSVEQSRETRTTAPNSRLPSKAAANVDDLVEQPTAEDIFQNIRTQYFEALYHSMGSLAYFAKGPLSRARAAFHLDCDSNLEMNDLIEFLKNLVMTTPLIDKKYRETVPDLIALMKTLVENSDGDSRRKKKKAKEMKLGRDGLYPTEDDHARKWWNANKPELREDEVSVKPEEVKYHIACLRSRETQLQMILILEIFALEKLRPVDDAKESQLPGMELMASPKPQDTKTASKKKNKHNLPFLIDVHADRLCIWQSTTLDEVKALAESQMSGTEGQKGKANSDPLKDFCTDVIIPFYSARLPELCDSLSRKLGGPVIVPTPKPKVSKSSASTLKSRPKPGTAAKRLAPPKASKSLDHVLSNERLRRSVSRGPTDAIAQMRSATVAPIPGLKREMSEPQSLGIPRQGSGSLKDRPVNLFSRSVSMSSTEDQRAQKKAMVKAELQDAISALKKPNRELVGKELVEAAERRLFAGPTHIRKAKKPTRNPLNRVQVKATPINNRYRDALVEESENRMSSRLPQIQEPDFVPSSGPRRGQKQMANSPFVANTPLANKVEATPLRASAVPGRLSKPSASEEFVPTSSHLQPIKSTMNLPRSAANGGLKIPVPHEFVPTSSPLQARKSAPAPQPSKNPDGEAVPTSSPGLGNPFQTPIKGRVKPLIMEETAIEKTPEATAGGQEKQNLTIYQQLGWDDEDIDDLA